uniref:TRAF-type domain-containing protein n=1 Tax=Anser cygnoides TaxID=8845 RepID=A0A8B9ELV4_ANSCY
MCAGCFIHLLADARLKEEQATCPNCRCEISKSLCCRNLAVEKAVSELPSECAFCAQQFPRSLLERHQKEECQDRVTQCKYKRIGCPWQGPFHELTVHEAECTHPTKTGNELMEILDEMDQTRKKEMQLYNSIFSLLSFEKIGYTGNARRRSAGCLGPWRRAGAARGLFVGFSDIFLYFFWRSSSEEEPAMLPRGSPLVSRGVTNPSPPPPSPRKRGVPPAAVRGQGHRAESRHQNPAVCGEPGALPARGRGAEPRSTAGDPRVLSPGRQTGREESGAGGGEGFSPRPGGAAVLRGRR